ncbi:MAG: glycine--tRNA ligase [Parcubacteria group bacterium]|jgi:glycyl-tRNA synthetase|nr:glycine--tRNA ligase [Parcubacteria group bacterium]
MKEENKMEKITSLCKRRGFIFQGSEIYGGLGGVYDYGHYGTLLKNNIRDAWQKSMIQDRDDVFILDSAIFVHPTTWEASGHIGNFDDPLIECRKCHNRMRADKILEDFGVDADKMPLDFINAELDKLRELKHLKCSSCGQTDITSAKKFSLMVKSNLGSPTDELKEENVVYLRPETCGGIYLQYKNTLDSLHPKLPFGIAQIGKAFRNEIAARQFIFRTREFEQMEMQYFIRQKDTKKMYDMWKEIRMNWYIENGIPAEKLTWYKHEKLAHYASEAYDIKYNFECFGIFDEVEGLHTRGDWDLTQHSKFSGVDLSYFDEESKERFVPHIIETSAGLNRLVLMFLDFAYTEDELGGDKRVFLKIPKHLAPVKVAVFPLLKNKPKLVEKAKEIYNSLRKEFMCEFDDNGNIGKRYRRQDEIGTPYCVTVDFDTLEKNEGVTVRDRDTGEQERVSEKELVEYLKERIFK